MEGFNFNMPLLGNCQNDLSYYMSIMYILIWTIISFIVELSSTFQSDNYWLCYSVFGVTMLSVEIVFFLLVYYSSSRQIPCFSGEEHIAIGANTFFIRLGAIVFAILAIIQWGIEEFLAFAQNVRPALCIFRTFLYIVFHAAQVLFVVHSARFVFRLPRWLTLFGLAHGIVVNLWIWISLCIAKSGLGRDENEEHHVNFRSDTWQLYPTDSPTIINTTFDRHEKKLRAVRYFGKTAITLLTADVEFCIISAGVLFSMFITLYRHQRPHQEERETVRYVGFDYRNTQKAVAFGVVMLILTCLSIAINQIIKHSDVQSDSDILIGSFQATFYLISIIICLITYHRFKNAPIREKPERGLEQQKTINGSFLLIGAGGEITFCFVTLISVIDGHMDGLSLATFLIRIVEVAVQTVLLLSLLENGHFINAKSKVLKQSTTALICLNVILFAFHTLETTVQSFGLPSKLDDTHLVLIKISVPLVVFYRFHCSLCFAEVWKLFYHEEIFAIPIVKSLHFDPIDPPVDQAILIAPDPDGNYLETGFE